MQCDGMARVGAELWAQASSKPGIISREKVKARYSY
jgi:hypothetical protein